MIPPVYQQTTTPAKASSTSFITPPSLDIAAKKIKIVRHFSLRINPQYAGMAYHFVGSN
jgi:hypothetical protein